MASIETLALGRCLRSLWLLAVSLLATEAFYRSAQFYLLTSKLLKSSARLVRFCRQWSTDAAERFAESRKI